MSIEPVSVTIATELRGEVEKMITDDVKMLGIAKYLASVEIFWSTAIPTACAGHGFIFFNPNWWNILPEQTRISVVAHEVWHLILKHLERGIEFDPEDYNWAGDYVINLILQLDGFTFEEWDCLLDTKYTGMSTEEVYNDIRDNKPKPPPDGKGGDGDSHDLDLPPPKDKTTPHVPRSVIEDLVKAAADTIAGNDDYNNVPKQIDKDKVKLEDLKISLGDQSGYDHIILEITGRKVAIKDTTYEEIFAKYLIDPISGAKRSFMRPNRRQHGMSDKNLRLPGRVKRNVKSNRLAHLIYCLDVSGSVTDIIRQQFHDSVRTIKELLNPNLLTVLFWDTQIKLIRTFKDTEPYGKIIVEAGGCTKLDCVYEYCATRNPTAVVIFTDLCVTIPEKPKWHTIWLVPERHREENVVNAYGDIYIIPKQE